MMRSRPWLRTSSAASRPSSLRRAWTRPTWTYVNTVDGYPFLC
jgi:hypothetical protein